MPTSDETLKPCEKDCGGYVCKFHSLEPVVQERIAQLEAEKEILRDMIGYDKVVVDREIQKRLDALKEGG